MKRLISGFFLVFALICLENSAHSQVTSASIRVYASKAEKRISKIRGFQFKRPVCHRVVGPKKMMKVIRDRIHGQYSTEDLQNEGDLLALLGILDSSNRYEERVFEDIEKNVKGYYDPDTQCLYLAQWLTIDEQIETLHHETAHALQDQHFDLAKLLRHRPGKSDRLNATSALVEGDATAVTIAALSDLGLGEFKNVLWPQKLRKSINSQKLQKGSIQRYLGSMAEFSYGYGFEYVQKRYLKAGWKGVNSRFRSPPRSTHEILSGSSPSSQKISINLGPLKTLPKGYSLAFQDTAGELLYRLALERRLPALQARKANKGWLYDRVAVYSKCGSGPYCSPSHKMLVAVILQQSQGEASLFHSDFVKTLSTHNGRPITSLDSGHTLIFRNQFGNGSSLSLSKKAVLYIENAPWKAWKALKNEVLDSLSGL